MTALQVYAILNKRIKGLISGVKSAVVNGTSIIWTMNDNTKVTMTFPKPKDGISVTDIKIQDKTVNGEIEKHLIFEMSDSSTIDGGKLDITGGGIIQKNSISQFPSKGKLDTLYFELAKETLYYWDGIKYKPISSSSEDTQISAEFKTMIIEFDGISDTFDLPVDNISYNVFVNGVYYTESIDYTIDTTVSPNLIIFNEIYDITDSCTLTYLKTVNSSGELDGKIEYATKTDIDNLFK